MATKIKVEQVTAGVMRVLALVAEQDATGVTQAPAATVRNPQYLPVKKCCASCKHRDIERAMRLRFCEVHEEEVHPSFCCDKWKMVNTMLLRFTGMTSKLGILIMLLMLSAQLSNIFM